MSTGPTAIVVGAGIAGLTAAFRLQQAGFAVRVLEAEAVVGGRMSSIEFGGFVMNRAATVLPGSYRAILELAAEVGFEGLERFDGTIGIVRDGVIHRMRSDHLALDGFRTKLLSWMSKLRLSRLAFDALRIRGKLGHDDISVAAPFDTQTAEEYGARHFNDESREYAIRPVIRGLAPDASIVEFFNASINILGAGFIRYPGGIGFLTEALAQRLSVTTEARVLPVRREGERARVQWEHAGEVHAADVDACVLAVPSVVAAKLLADADPGLSELLSKSLRYTTAFVAHFGLSCAPAEPSMFLMLPKSEDPGMYSLVFDHNLQPDRVPEGKGLLATSWEHDWCEQRLESSDDELIEQMLPSVEALVPEVREHLEFTRVHRWRPGVLRGSPGYCTAIAELVERLEQSGPVQLAGDFFTTSSTDGSVVSAERAVTRLIDRMG
ncbi:MAG: NAD(P)/FAD-dependent oxidoreductase [Myxococcota bacterium]